MTASSVVLYQLAMDQSCTLPPVVQAWTSLFQLLAEHTNASIKVVARIFSLGGLGRGAAGRFN